MVPVTAELSSPTRVETRWRGIGQPPCTASCTATDRALFLVTTFAPPTAVIARARAWSAAPPESCTRRQWEKALAYMRPFRIRDVLLSGGDPLTLPDDELEWLLIRFAAFACGNRPHRQKVPMVLPSASPQPHTNAQALPSLWMNIHCTHPDELTTEAVEALRTALRRGNTAWKPDRAARGHQRQRRDLRHALSRPASRRVRPYYLYQCDPIVGSSHFRTTVEKGIDMIRGSGAIQRDSRFPRMSSTLPAAARKIPLLPEYLAGREGRRHPAPQYENDVPLPGHGRGGHPRHGEPLVRIALAYDLRDDYRAMGYGEEESPSSTASRRSTHRFGPPGWATRSERIGHLGAILPRLSPGERWDIVFNITEGLYGIAREAQVPALLDAYRIPYTFSDTSVLALTMHKALCKRVVRDLGVPTPDFAAYILLKKSNPSTFPFLCSSSPRGGTGTA